MLLSVELAAGERLLIGTDPLSWRGSSGPITGDDIYLGESYVMAQEVAGWSSGSFNVTAWDATTVVPDALLAGAARSWQAVQPVRARRGTPIAAVSVSAPTAAQFVVDLGVNSAGWTRLSLPGGCPAGTVVLLRHAENLFADGTVDQGNLRSAKATEALTCDGRAAAFVYEPRFTYHGFRYVGVEQWPVAALGAPTAALFAKIEVHNAVEHAGDATPSALAFAPSSSVALAAIHDIVRRGQLSNLHGGVATDCPQRDERQGWLADASVSAESAISSWDMQAFYRSWLRTITDSQASAAELKDCAPDSPIYPDCDGADTDTSPHVPGLFGNRPADPSWGAALDIIYDLLLRYFDDRDEALAFYPSLAAYADYLLRIADKTGGLVTFHWYGDWLQPNQVASTDYVSTQASRAAAGRRESHGRYLPGAHTSRPHLALPPAHVPTCPLARPPTHPLAHAPARRPLHSASCAHCASLSTLQQCSARPRTRSDTRRATSRPRPRTTRPSSMCPAAGATAPAARTSRCIRGT